MIRRYILCVTLGLVCITSEAQTVTVDAEIRPRIEYRDGYNKPLPETNDPGVFGIQRTRLNLSYKSDVLNSLITFQDARTYGQTSNMSETPTTGIYEAWGEVLLGAEIWLKIGRQALRYDDNRLFSSPAWSNTGTSHDVALFKYSVNDFQAHVGFAYNNNTAISSETFYNPASKYRSLGFVWLSKNITKLLILTAIGVDEGVQDTLSTGLKNYKKISLNHAFSVGGNLKFESKISPLTALATAYFQTGKSALGSSLSGKLLALKVGYKFKDYLSINVGADYLSGDNSANDGKQTNFKKLYGADHTFNGTMDYWDTPLSQGLLDYYSEVKAKVSKNLNLQSEFHVFRTDKPLYKTNTNLVHNLGSEFDFVVNYKLNSWATVEGAWSTYFTTSNTLFAKGISVPNRTPQWAYIMFSIRPAFLK